jgi:glucokinase
MAWIGIDIGGTFIKGGLVADDGRVERTARRDSERFDLTALSAKIDDLVGELGADAGPRGIGVGAPGLVSNASVDFAPNMPALNGRDLAGIVGSRTGLPAVVRNDADMNAWGEFLAGAGQGVTHMVCITIGTGLGSGVIIDGKLHGGASGYGAEAGHIVVDPDGGPCCCGGRGCLETLVSAPAIVRRVEDALGKGRRSVLADGEAVTAKRVSEAATGGDELSVDTLSETGRYLGIGLTTLINVLNPEAIIVGGGVAAAGRLLLDPARREVDARAYSRLSQACRIVPAALGSDAGMVGAALFAMEYLGKASGRRHPAPAG